MCAAGLEPCLFKRILELSPLRQVLFRMGIHCASGSLDAEWLQAIQNLLGDGAINPSAPERDAIAGTHLVGGAAASVALRWTALAAVADRELSPAAREDKSDRVLHATIGILFDPVIIGLQIANRDRPDEFAAPGLLLDGLSRALAENRQLHLAHSSLHAKQQPVVWRARFIHTVLIDNERTNQSAELEQGVPITSV